MALWQNLTQQDLGHLDEHSRLYPPYCHVNIVDLWAYKVTDNYWFEVGDTIAYKLNDYNDDSLYLTLLGHKQARQAIKLIAGEEEHGAELELRCVPETTLKSLGDWDAIVRFHEDHDNHDYIFDILKLRAFDSEGLRAQAKKFRKLLRLHPGLHHKVLDHRSEADRQKIYAVFHGWVEQTGASHWHKEFRALQRALGLDEAGLVCLGFYDGHEMIGYTVNRPEPDGYYQAYFGKADRRYNSLTLFQEQTTAAYMQENFGCTHMNLQPDQGLAGLRSFKKTLGPSGYLKKFTVIIDRARCLAES